MYILIRGDDMKENGKEKLSFADMPTGLTYALARNIGAMRVFAQMPNDKRQTVIDGARDVSTKQEMRSYVAQLSKYEQI